MMNPSNDIATLIPHRPPFLWVDKIISCEDACITTEKEIPHDLDLLTGHYPGNPIMPGVLLCEAIFQSGALLMAKMKSATGDATDTTPVLTRIGRAKFKKIVHPGDVARIKVRLTETISAVYFFKGTMKVDGKTAVQVDFACALIPSKA